MFYCSCVELKHLMASRKSCDTPGDGKHSSSQPRAEQMSANVSSHVMPILSTYIQCYIFTYIYNIYIYTHVHNITKLNKINLIYIYIYIYIYISSIIIIQSYSNSSYASVLWILFKVFLLHGSYNKPGP